MVNMKYGSFNVIAFSSLFLAINATEKAMASQPNFIIVEAEDPKMVQPKALSLVNSDLRLDKGEEADSKLQVGPKWWGKQKQFCLNIFKNQVPARTVVGSFLPEASEIKNYFTKGLAQKIQGIFDLEGQPIDIIIEGGKHGLITQHLFHSLSITLKTLSDELAKNFEQAKYVKSDIEILKNQTKNALLIAHYTDNFFNHYFGQEEVSFSQEEIENLLKTPRYIQAKHANEIIPYLKALTALKNNELDGMGYLWYMNREFKIYLNNTYYVLNEHLKTSDPALKRAITPGLSIQLETYSIRDFETEVKQLLQQELKVFLK